MRSKTTAALLGICLGGLAAAAPSQAAAATCVKQPGTTIASNAQARVYETEPFASEGGSLSSLWGCRAGSHSRVRLAEAYEDPFGNEGEYTSVRLAGRLVALVTTTVSADTGTSHEIERMELGTKRRDTAFVTRPVGLVMTAAGGVAWIESGAVRALGGPGVVTLDAGPAKPGSLKRASRSSVSWVRGGTRRTARVS